MDSLNQASNLHNTCGDAERDIEFSRVLEIFVHHARNIHNICIYDNQDVYAKFCLTYNPDETTSTRVIVGGGKNPEFNEKLKLKVNQIDSVLKCEIWMLSRAKNLLEDQLLGFALVPVSLLTSQGGKISCQDFSLSSTDLFHCPAGTVQLSLAFFSSTNSSVSGSSSSISNPLASSSISSEVVLLDKNEYSRVEFLDMNAATRDQMMVSEYFNLNAKSSPMGCQQNASFLQHLQGRYGDDNQLVGNSSKENEKSSSSSTRNSAVLIPSMMKMNDCKQMEDSSVIGNEVEGGGMEKSTSYCNMGRVILGWGGNVELEAEQATMQQQVMDKYMKSMQQFTETLSKVKLPTSLDPNPDSRSSGDVIGVVEKSNNNLEMESKKDGSRVFYGGTAFF